MIDLTVFLFYPSCFMKLLDLFLQHISPRECNKKTSTQLQENKLETFLSGNEREQSTTTTKILDLHKKVGTPDNG